MIRNVKQAGVPWGGAVELLDRNSESLRLSPQFHPGAVPWGSIPGKSSFLHGALYDCRATANMFLAPGHRTLSPSQCRKPQRHTAGHPPSCPLCVLPRSKDCRSLIPGSFPVLRVGTRIRRIIRHCHPSPICTPSGVSRDPRLLALPRLCIRVGALVRRTGGHCHPAGCARRLESTVWQSDPRIAAGPCRHQLSVPRGAPESSRHALVRRYYV
jgi:hypothetical protein